MSKRKHLYISQRAANKLLVDIFKDVKGLPNIKVRSDGAGTIDFYDYDKSLKDLVELIREGEIKDENIRYDESK
jgi:hypothetical protein